MKTILVTGAAGYVGATTVLHLRDRGFRVLGVDDLSNGDAAFLGLSDLGVELDVRTGGPLVELLRAERVSGIVHCAAYAVVADSVRDPVGYFENNIRGSSTVIDAAVRAGKIPVVFSSSATVYGAPDVSPIFETAPRLPIHPYGFTKLAGERALEFADRAHGLRSVSLRYFNAAGADPSGRAGERHVIETRVLPNLLRAVFTVDSPFQMAGDDWPTADGTCVRDYVHTSDIAAAHLAALQYLWAGGRTEAVNIGGGGPGTSVRELIRAVESATGRRVPIEVGPRRPGDAPVLVASIERASAVLGWAPTASNLDNIVRTAAAWHEHELQRYPRRPSDLFQLED